MMKELSIGDKIYGELGDETVNFNVIIKGELYEKEGVKHAKNIGGVFSLELRSSVKHFGNPYSSIDNLENREAFIRVPTTKDSVIAYINWVITSKEDRALWIRGVLDSKVLIGKPIIYDKDLGEPSHATALGYLITNWEDIKSKTKNCKECNNPIPIARLNAISGVKTCVKCQEELENGKKSTNIDNGKCKRCGAPMESRHSKKTTPVKYFLGCKNYPKCTYTIWPD